MCSLTAEQLLGLTLLVSHYDILYVTIQGLNLYWVENVCWSKLPMLYIARDLIVERQCT